MHDPTDPPFAIIDFSGSAINRELNSEDKVGFYRKMVEIRRFEQACLK